MDCKLTPAEINHLRRLIGWVACEIGQSPDEMVATVQRIAPAIQDASEEGKARLVQAHQNASSVPKYVRAAIKALRNAIEPHLGDVVDADYSQERQLPATKTRGPMRCERHGGYGFTSDCVECNPAPNERRSPAAKRSGAA